MAKKRKIDGDEFLSTYMEFVGKNGRLPKNFTSFLKRHKVENDERSAITSFKELNRHIFYLFHLQSIGLLEQSEDYLGFNAQNKLLSYYYTFFELLAANEAYVKVILEQDSSIISSQSVLKRFKKSFLTYIDHLPIEKFELYDKSLNKFQGQFLRSAGWIQFMSLVKFWLRDRSSAYEKTDIFIEKLVNTSFDLINIKPVLSVIDLGKFIVKETIKGKK